MGNKAFRKELLAQIAERAGSSHYGEELRESAEAKAQRIVAAELKRLHWKEDDLQAHRKGDPKKVKIARRLRQEFGRDMLLVALTGYGQEEDRRRALEAGFDAHLTKPADPAVLRRLLEQPPSEQS